MIQDINSIKPYHHSLTNIDDTYSSYALSFCIYVCVISYNVDQDCEELI